MRLVSLNTGSAMHQNIYPRKTVGLKYSLICLYILIKTVLCSHYHKETTPRSINSEPVDNRDSILQVDQRF